MMNDHPLIADMREKAKSENEYDKLAALLFALQIPSICSRIEIPRSDVNSGKPNDARDNPTVVLYNVKNGEPFDKNLYFAWLRKHRRTFIPWFVRLMPFEVLCEVIYNLRNDMTHAGNLLELDSRLVLIDSDEAGSLFSGRTLYVSVSKFCDTMFDAAREVFSGNDYWPPEINKADKNLSLHLLPDADFQQIRRDLDIKYHEFWRDRDDDLRLYRAYCFTMIGHLDEIERRMAEKPEWSLGGLTRTEMERLVEVVHECDALGDKFDVEIAEKYFKRKE